MVAAVANRLRGVALVRLAIGVLVLTPTVGVGATAVAQQPTTSPAPKLLEAERILDGYVEVTGGERAYKQLRSRVTRGTFEIPSLGTTGTIETYAMSPDKLYAVTQIGSLGQIERGYDGKTAWEYNEMLGARLYTGGARAYMVREATFNADLCWRELCKSVKTVGVETINERPAYKVAIVTTDDSPMTMYYDKETNLLVRVDAKAMTQAGEVAVEVYPSDYRKVNGILVPHKSTQKILGMTQVSTFDTIEFNTRIPSDKFELPAEVKKLVK